ncbi:hypothetical protein A1E_05200 [Rickettsia canadensis str. McKiel]|uniref:Uncharacterized protein n=1 Tax=Rickettsia canadensis (strain McKiel) TaxID=293613 RepID=A8F023_RICCK|nr:hypothetical protein [Rickettsia canadensis]ABV73956.1 hypothetical protein A1E_05200 [Rickettsia canadensis str. McKiel]
MITDSVAPVGFGPNDLGMGGDILTGVSIIGGVFIPSDLSNPANKAVPVSCSGFGYGT